MTNDGRRPCGHPTRWPRVFRGPHAGNRAACSCCGLTEDVVTLPVGKTERAAYCAPCLHDGKAPLATGPHAATRFRDELPKLERGYCYVDAEHLPASLVRFVMTPREDA